MISNGTEKILYIPIFDGNHSTKDLNSAVCQTDCASKGSSKNHNFGIKPTLERKRTSLASPPNKMSDKFSVHKSGHLSQNSQSKSRSNSRSSNVNRGG